MKLFRINNNFYQFYNNNKNHFSFRNSLTFGISNECQELKYKEISR